MPEHVLAEARARADKGGLSAYLTAAVEASLAADRLRDLLDELDAEHGPVPEALVAEAEAAWPRST
ncbi:hypothetical protein [Modestobacter lapidis]|nr:CopG family transcriptional regulator [Modestobacter lapidis]